MVRRSMAAGAALAVCLTAIPASLLAQPDWGPPEREGRGGRGCEMIVYRDADYGGQSQEFYSGEPNVGDYWNDQISSVQIVSGVGAFFWEVGFQGERFTAGPGGYRYVGDHWNDQISSFRCIRPTRAR